MATFKPVNKGSTLSGIIDYVTNEKKTNRDLVSGINCDQDNVKEQMECTKELYGKKGGRQYGHFVFSFAPGEKVSPEKVHQLSIELAKKLFSGHECLIVTHIDKDTLHSHIIVNSVNMETGKKLHTTSKWLANAKDYCNHLCCANGLSLNRKGYTFEGKPRTEATTWNRGKYEVLNKANANIYKSFVYNAGIAVIEAKAQAHSKGEFIQAMAKKGFTTNWQNNHKHIVFIDEKGHKVRLSNISKTFHINLTKDSLLEDFKNYAQSIPAKQHSQVTQNTQVIKQSKSTPQNQPVQHSQVKVKRSLKLKPKYNKVRTGSHALKHLAAAADAILSDKDALPIDFKLPEDEEDWKDLDEVERAEREMQSGWER